tara:strand:- start:12696 stop:13187 length:492 start_codon:yes stop_codon:yes gene_type:complete
MSINTLISTISKTLIANQQMLVTAESCTGGLVAAACTSVPGSSQWFERGFVTYTNDAKMECLGVDADVIEKFGAVSEETAKHMAEGALQHSHAQVAIATTGIAGPDGGSDEKPVGTVCFAWAIQGQNTQMATQVFNGDRQAVREQAVEFVLQMLHQRLDTIFC